MSLPYATREVHVRELADLVAGVRYPGSSGGATASWTVFRDGQEVFRHVRGERVEVDEAAQTVRLATPFAPAAPGHYRFRLRVSVHRSFATTPHLRERLAGRAAGGHLVREGTWDTRHQVLYLLMAQDDGSSIRP